MFRKILIANRGEIAVRLARAVQDLGWVAVAVYALDDAQALHVRTANEAIVLDGLTTASTYLNIPQLVAIALETGCDAVHPGYGFLSERADFAHACADAGLTFIGPTPAQLALFGNKASARRLAVVQQVPVMPGSAHSVTLAEAQAFWIEQQGAGACGLIIKAIGGGGGRGMRVVHHVAELPEAYARCQSEALSAFGVAGVYVERFMPHARHIEVQVLGDGQDVIALGERECSVQRRFQKLVEIAPSPSLTPAMRAQVTEAALRLARASAYQSLGTFEFLVDERASDLPFVFIEANARLQVEHTVTEAVLGLDLVQLQIAVATGASLTSLGLDSRHPPQPKGHAIQWRVNAELIDATGIARPGSGTLSHFELPQGPGIRVDTHGYVSASPSPHYDSLLAKLIVHTSGDFAQVLRRSRRALAQCLIEGLPTNLALLQAIAHDAAFATQAVDTIYVESHWPQLHAAALQYSAKSGAKLASKTIAENTIDTSRNRGFEFNISALSDGQFLVQSNMAGRVVQTDAAVGDTVRAGQQLAVLEAMKMEHLVLSPQAGKIVEILCAAGDWVGEGQVLMLLHAQSVGGLDLAPVAPPGPEHIRPDLQRLRDRLAFTQDAQRPVAVAKRHDQGGRMVRENIDALCSLSDGGSFTEYGALAVAAQARRRSADDLIANTPADGMVTGIGTVNAADFGAEKSRCVILAYDYTVLAGTQGWRNHHKKDRMLGLAHQLKLPVILFAEGGGGRPGDIDMPVVAGLNNHTFRQFAALSGKVPVIGIVHGRCFAGNAALLGCADVIIATAASNIGMGGPAMIEGGGLGQFRPEDIGPSAVQSANGVIDVLVSDEVQAVAIARQYLSYFQGPVAHWSCADQGLLRHAVPENRLRVYDVRAVMRGLVDTDSLLELRAGFGLGILTALARIEGKPIGLIANNPLHLGGAIDAPGADKAARFMQLCNAHGLPIVSLMDTPGFMVGPDIEAQAQVRHVCRLFVVAAHLSVPFFSVVLRKGYGLGAQAMAAGGFDAPVFNVSWPTGEFGGMGLEGAVRLGFRKELEAQPEGAVRDALFKKLVDQQYRNGEAVNMAATLEIDAVIDPADTRAWLVNGLASVTGMPRDPSAGRFVDTW